MKELKKDVAQKYRVLTGHGIGEYRWKGYRAHLDLIDLATADKLVADGFPYLVAIEGAGEKKKLTEGVE